MIKTIYAVLIIMGGAARITQASNTITNYKSGISIGINGTDGADFVFERWYGDSLVDDHGVIYIRSDADISFSHNERNINALDSIDIGTIRYKVDRDLSYKCVWSGRYRDTTTVYELPGFTAPFAFDDLTYAPEFPGGPVVGTTGPVPGTVHEMSRDSYYDYWYRGLLDEAGDEWHIITVGDDDTELMESGDIRDVSSNMRLTGNDGKIHYFIVNPTTPAIWFTAGDTTAEWYTTPAKAYFIPKIHEQTTYLTDGVSIHLANIMSAAPVYYRIDGGSYAQYTAPVSVDGLSDGPHTLECYYTDGTVRTRALVKNPGFPSDDDRFEDGSGHGTLVWEDDTVLNGIKDRLFTADTNKVINTLRQRYNIFKTNGSASGNGQTWYWDQARQGKRVCIGSNTTPFINALLPVLEGFSTYPEHLRTAKHMLLENEFIIDPVGFELDMNFMCIPSHTERINLGYYLNKGIISLAHAYDLLIMDYRYPEYADGFTPIEDLKARDGLASSVLLSLHDRQGLLYHAGMGITMESRAIGGLVASMAMPSYNTPYYGTSGYDGTSAANTWLPFPDQAVTWKELFYLDNVPVMEYPNQVFKLGMHANDTMTFVLPTLPSGSKDIGSTYGNIRDDGISNYPSSTIVYNSFHQMGFTFGVYSNTMRTTPGHGQDLGYLDRYFAACIDSQQPWDLVHHDTVGFYPNPLVCNERHPDVAERALKRIWYDDIWSPIQGQVGAIPYYLVWVNEDWENRVSAIDDPQTVLPSRITGMMNPVTCRLVLPLQPGIDPASVKLYRTDGTAVDVSVVERNNMLQADVSTLPAGIYHCVAGERCATFIKQ